MTNVGNAEVTVTLGLDQLIKDAVRAQQLLKEKLKDQKIQVDLDGSLVGKLNAQAKAFQDAVAGASQYTQALGEVSRQLGAAGDQINDFTRQAVQAAIAFDSAKAKVATLSDDADGLATRMEALSKELNFQSNSTDLLNASYDVLSSGISETADVAQVLKASTQGALGGFTDVGTVSDAVTTIISAYKSYGFAAKDAQRIVDELAKTQDLGKITIGQYASQIGQVASTAALAGVKLEEVNAAVATATAKGQDSSSAISGVRQAVVSLLKPTDEAKKYLAEFGITNSAATLKTEGLVGILERLKKAGATTDQLSKVFSDVTGLATVATLANENLGDFKSNLDAMGNSAGKAAQSAEKVANSMQGQLNAALNQANEALKDLGNGATKAISPLLQALTFLVQNFNQLPKPVKESVGAVVALTGGAVTLLAALAGFAAVLPIVTAGLISISPAGAAAAAAVTATAAAEGAATVATVSLGAALTSFLPVLIAVAAGIAAIKFAAFVKDLTDANLAIGTASKQIETDANGAFAAANRTKNTIAELNKAKESGRALTKDEIQDAQKLYQANEQRLAQLKEDLQLAQQLPAADDAQKQSKANLIQQTQTTIKALEGQNNALKGLLPTNQKTAESNKAVALTLEQINDKYKKSTSEIEQANKLRQAAIAESINQGLITEEEGRTQNLEQEKKFLNERLQLNQSKLEELKGLAASEKDPVKLKEVNSQILQLENELADGRLSIAQKGAEERKAVEDKAQKELEDSINAALSKVNQSKSDRTVAVKQKQSSGQIDGQTAAQQEAQIEQDTIAKTIAAKQQELADIRKLRQQRVGDARKSAQQEAGVLQELGDLAVQQVDAEINAQKGVLSAVQQRAADELTTVRNNQAEKLAAVKEAQAAQGLSEEEAARRSAAINKAAVQESIRIKEEELTRLRNSGVSIKEKAEQEKQVIGEIAGLRQQAAEAEIASQQDLLNAIKKNADDEVQTVSNTEAQKIAAIKESQANRVIDEQTANEQIAQVNRDSAAANLKIKEDELAKVQALRKSGEDRTEKSAEREKALIGEVAQARQKAAESEVALRQKQTNALDVELAAIKTAVDETVGLNQIRAQSLQNQNDLLSAQSSLLAAQSNLQQQRLQTQLKEVESTGDVLRAEGIKRQIAEEQLRTTEKQNQIELEQLRLKQEKNKIDLENSFIQANIAKSEAEINLEKAQVNNASAAELANLQRILGLRQQQLDAIQRQTASQEKINALEEQALRTKQQQTLETYKQSNVQAAIIGVDTGSSIGVNGAGSSGGNSSSSGSGSSGGSAGSGGGGGNQPLSVTAITDKLTDIANNGDLATKFSVAGANLGLKLGLQSSIPGVGGLNGIGGDSGIAGKLDQLIAVTKNNGSRPNLSISNVNDLGMAGQIYNDLSRDSFRSSGL